MNTIYVELIFDEMINDVKESILETYRINFDD